MPSDVILTPHFRCNFVKIFEKDKKFGRYGVTMCFPDGTDLSELENAIKAEAKSAFGKDAPKILKKNNLFQTQEDSDCHPEGFVCIKANSQFEVSVRDRKGEPITCEEDSPIKSGSLCRAKVVAASYNNESRGVTLYLNGIQFLKGDEPFYEGVETEFEPVEGDEDDGDWSEEPIPEDDIPF